MSRSDYYVYCWTNSVNGKRYVGKGRRSRARVHFAPWYLAESETAFARAIRKHGSDAFTLQIVAEGLTDTKARDLERLAIAQLNSFGAGGYNCTVGGDGSEGFRHSAEAIARMSALRKRSANAELLRARAHKKLTDSDVRKIRTNRGFILQCGLAEAFGVAISTICQAQRGEHWAHLPGAVVFAIPKGKSMLPEGHPNYERARKRREYRARVSCTPRTARDTMST